MHYEFSPDERISNILFVIERLLDMQGQRDSIDPMSAVFDQAIKRNLEALDEAVADMAPPRIEVKP